MRRNRVQPKRRQSTGDDHSKGASILVIFAVGGAPVETSARGGAFIGGPVAPFHSGFQTPMSRAAIAPPRRVVTPAPMIRPAIALAPPRQVVAPARIRAVPLTHIQHRRAPVVVWGYAPWYSGDDGWYRVMGRLRRAVTIIGPMSRPASKIHPIPIRPRTLTRGLAVWAAERRLIMFLRQMTG